MDLRIKIDKPEAFTKEEKDTFLFLLKKQAQVDNPNLGKVNASPYLCLCFDGAALIGIGAIKDVYKIPFTKAGLEKLSKDYDYELGYLYINDDTSTYRNLGLGKLITKLLIQKCKHINLFATTSISENNPMVHILKKLGFKLAGSQYIGRKSKKTIGLFLLQADHE